MFSWHIKRNPWCNMGQEVSQKNIVEASNTENAAHRKIPVLGSFLIRLLANSLQLF